jgi:hypothetical protein
MSIFEGLLVRINDCNNDFFLTSRGVRQGDPISHILFNFMVDIFTKIFSKAAANRHLASLMQEMGVGVL